MGLKLSSTMFSTDYQQLMSIISQCIYECNSMKFATCHRGSVKRWTNSDAGRIALWKRSKPAHGRKRGRECFHKTLMQFLVAFNYTERETAKLHRFL